MDWQKYSRELNNIFIHSYVEFLLKNEGYDFNEKIFKKELAAGSLEEQRKLLLNYLHLQIKKITENIDVTINYNTVN